MAAFESKWDTNTISTEPMFWVFYLSKNNAERFPGRLPLLMV